MNIGCIGGFCPRTERDFVHACVCGGDELGLSHSVTIDYFPYLCAE